MLAIGALLLIGGIAITFASYMAAESGNNGGRFQIWYGVMMLGMYLVLHGRFSR